MKLPSNKASLLILSIVIISTLIIIISNYRDKNPTQENQGVVTSLNVDNQIKETNIDSDGDGLLNWKESLWGTDPLKYDTDGDGTNDNEEIINNRNPLIAGPGDDNYNFNDKIIAQIGSRKFSEDGLTNKVATNFAQDYFSAREGGDLNLAQKESLIEQISSQAIDDVIVEPIYNPSSIKTFQKTNEEKLIKYTDVYLANQIDILSETISSYNKKNYDFLGNYIIGKSAELMFMEVPSQISVTHTNLANKYYQLGKVVQSFEKEEEDPLFVMLSIRLYDDLQLEIKDINTQIGNFLSDNGIILEDDGIKIKND